MTADQLQAARAAHWRQQQNPLLTLEDAEGWLAQHPLCLFLPRTAQLPAPAPSLVEACLGHREVTPGAAAIAQAQGWLTRLAATGTVVGLNLLGAVTEQPDFVAHRDALPYVVCLRADADWKQAPKKSSGHKVSPLVLELWKVLEQAGATTANQAREALGRELTEAAVLRALCELWQGLRISPVGQGEDQPASWEMLRVQHRAALTLAAATSQVTALSLLVSMYLQSVYAASSEEIEVFLSPMASRSRVREAVRGLAATRQIHSLSMDAQTYYFLENGLPEFALASAEPEMAVPDAATAARSAPIFRRPGVRPETRLGARPEPPVGARPRFAAGAPPRREPGAARPTAGAPRRRESVPAQATGAGRSGARPYTKPATPGQEAGRSGARPYTRPASPGREAGRSGARPYTRPASPGREAGRSGARPYTRPASPGREADRSGARPYTRPATPGREGGRPGTGPRTGSRPMEAGKAAPTRRVPGGSGSRPNARPRPSFGGRQAETPKPWALPKRSSRPGAVAGGRPVAPAGGNAAHDAGFPRGPAERRPFAKDPRAASRTGPGAASRSGPRPGQGPRSGGERARAYGKQRFADRTPTDPGTAGPSVRPAAGSRAGETGNRPTRATFGKGPRPGSGASPKFAGAGPGSAAAPVGRGPRSLKPAAGQANRPPGGFGRARSGGYAKPGVKPAFPRKPGGPGAAGRTPRGPGFTSASSGASSFRREARPATDKRGPGTGARKPERTRPAGKPTERPRRDKKIPGQKPPRV